MRESLEGLRKTVEGRRRGWNPDNMPNHRLSIAEGAENPMGGASRLHA
jgi:hypothetical protein